MNENLEEQIQESIPLTSVAEFQPLDPRAVKLWRTTYLIGFGLLILATLAVVISVGWAEPSVRIWLAVGWLPGLAG